MANQSHPVQRLTLPTLLTALLISVVPATGALAQQAPTADAFGAPADPIHLFQARFNIVDAPAYFDKVLQVVVFSDGAWTPQHTSGGYVYTTVIDGAISTRVTRAQGVDEATYEAGESFVQRPGEFMQIGNATTSNARILATALLPTHMPLTIYRDGFTSSAYPTLTDWNYTHDISLSAPGPTTVHRSSVGVSRPAGAFELVQLVLEHTILPPTLILPDWAQTARLNGSPVEASPTGDEVRESCLDVLGRVSANQMVEVNSQSFERVAANLCVRSTYMSYSAAGQPY